MSNAFTSSGLFGGLFSDSAVAGAFGMPAFCGKMLAFEAAWTRALAAEGVVSQADADLALMAIAGFHPDGLGAGSDRDGLPVPAMVAALRQGLPPGAARAIHSGATSQDVIDTATVLTCLEVATLLETRLLQVVAGLDALVARDGESPMMARTRMQAALPATVALRLDAWRRPLVDHLSRLAALRAGMARVQVGGAIGLRDAPGGAQMAERVAADLGLGSGPVWHTDRSTFVDFGHWLMLVAGSLGKIGQDMALMAQGAEISLSGGGGSSAMPHKQNPIAAEVLVALARFVAGQQGILGQAMVHEQERSGTAWALEWLTLPAMAEGTGAATRHAVALISQITRVGAVADPE